MTIANLWVAWQASGQIRTWWLIAALAALGDRIFTFSYFIPQMIGLLGAADSPEARARSLRWAHLNYVRQALVLVAWITALQSFALLSTRLG